MSDTFHPSGRCPYRLLGGRRCALEADHAGPCQKELAIAYRCSVCDVTLRAEGMATGPLVCGRADCPGPRMRLSVVGDV